MKKLTLKLLIFIVLFLSILYNIDHYFGKDDFTFKKYRLFYKQKKESLDAIILGNSHAGEGISSDIIKAKTGLNTFNFGVGGVTFFETYYNLLETLQYHNPRLVIIETYNFVGQSSKYNKIPLDNKSVLKERKYQSTLYGKKIGLTKIKEAKLSISDYNFLKTFNIFKYHENWSDIKVFFNVLNDNNKKLEYPYLDSFKNVIFMSNELAENFDHQKYNTPFTLPQTSKEYLDKIISLSKEKDFKLLFVTLPSYKKYYKARKNELDNFNNQLDFFLTKKDKTIKLLDLNKELDLDKSNFRGVPKNIKYDYKNQHLNYKGNIKATNLISNFINKTYYFTKHKNDFDTPQDIFYNNLNTPNSSEFEGKILNITNNIVSKFQGSLDKSAVVKNNLIKDNNKLDNPKWYKNKIKVFSDAAITPNKTLTADKIVGLKSKNGYIAYNTQKKIGAFKFSVWLKGSGSANIVLQENGGDYTKYASKKINLTSDWKEYFIEKTKENDLNTLRCVISGIKNTETLYIWNTRLIEIELNKLKFSSQFDKQDWYKNKIKVTPNFMMAPNGKQVAEKITGIKESGGYILQNFFKKTGTFEFSVWLKGSGTTKLVIQEDGGNYTRYGEYKIKLTKKWSKYILKTTKDNDLNSFRCVIGDIKKSDTIYLWNAKLIEIDNTKLSNEIIVSKNTDKFKITGWMNLKDETIKDKYIILKKDNTFSYISLKKQIKTIEEQNKGRKHIYIFETPKNILEKGKYKIFQIVRSNKNKFYMRKLPNSIIVE